MIIEKQDFEKVFTLQSIKSRIETFGVPSLQADHELFLLYSPLNQGLKRSNSNIIEFDIEVFTLQSIKSRIETINTSSSLMA